MLTPTFTKLFKKEYKLMQKRGMETDKLREVIDMWRTICKPKPL